LSICLSENGHLFEMPRNMLRESQIISH